MLLLIELLFRNEQGCSQNNREETYFVYHIRSTFLNLTSGEGAFPLNDIFCQWTGVCLNPYVD